MMHRVNGGGTTSIGAILLLVLLTIIAAFQLVILVQNTRHSAVTSESIAMTQQGQRDQSETIHSLSNKLDTLQGTIAATASQNPSVVVSQRRPSPPVSDPVPAPMDADTLIIGAGVAGLVAGYRLAPKLHERLLIVDDRNKIGGVVQSRRFMGSNNTKPTWTPTHAEQLLDSHTTLRCLAQEIGTPMVITRPTGQFVEAFIRGYNSSGKLCYGPSEVPPSNGYDLSQCTAGWPQEAVAPNGWIGNVTEVYPGMPDVCAGQSWYVCSYEEQLWALAGQKKNTDTISVNESLRQYLTRILGESASSYLFEVSASEFMAPVSAKFYFNELVPYESYAGSFLTVPHGGPQVGIWARVGHLIESNQSRIKLNTRIVSVDYNLNPSNKKLYKYVATASSGQKFFARRVIFAVNANAMRTMQGSIGGSIAPSNYLKKINTGTSCTWNAFWPSKFWFPDRLICSYGPLCGRLSFNYTYSGVTGNYASWLFWDTPSAHPDSLGYAEYRGVVPERNEHGLIRFVFETPESSAPLKAIFEAGGNSAVTAEMMRRFRKRFGTAIQNIPNPEEAYIQCEDTYGAYLEPGTTFTSVQLERYAQRPIPGENICLASTSYRVLDGGWMEGAAKSAHSCLSGQAFSDLFAPGQLQGLERCRANTTGNKANRYLDFNNRNSLGDQCLLMRHEHHPWDWMNISNPALGLTGSYCGGPKSYDWPTAAELDPDGIYSTNEADWNGVTSTYHGDSFRRQGHRRWSPATP